jgi:ribosomal-protein-alanine N-acetyltransferase
MNANAIVISDRFTISDASLFDVPAVWRLERLCFPNDAYDIFTLLSLALTRSVLRLKAVVNNQLVGYVAGELRRHEQMGWIVTIGVAPKHQGHGIGRAMLASVERAMRPGAAMMRLTVRRSNARAIALYDRCGYKWVSTIRRYYHDGEDGLIMEKDLTSL